MNFNMATTIVIALMVGVDTFQRAAWSCLMLFAASWNFGRFTLSSVVVSRSSQTGQDEEHLKVELTSSWSETTPMQRSTATHTISHNTRSTSPLTSASTYAQKSRDCGSVGARATGNDFTRARKERRGLPVVTGSTGRTSCGTQSGSDLPTTFHSEPPHIVLHEPSSTFHNGDVR